MKSFTVPAADAELRYHDIAGEGPALLFIHGLGCASSCDYPSVAADAALRGRRMLLVDLLGSGFSDRPTGFGYTIEDHARSIVAMTEHVRLIELDLFGHSMGGAVAITAARMLGGRLRRLVLGEPNLEPGGGFFSRRIAAMTERDYVERGHDELVQASRTEGNAIWAASLAISAPMRRIAGPAHWSPGAARAGARCSQICRSRVLSCSEMLRFRAAMPRVFPGSASTSPSYRRLDIPWPGRIRPAWPRRSHVPRAG